MTETQLVRLLIVEQAAIIILCGLLAILIYKLRKLRKSPPPSDLREPEALPEQASVNDSSPATVYSMISHAIVSEQLFLNPNLCRQDLMDRFHVSKEAIGQAFSSYGTSIPAFINACRLEYAGELLKTQPDLSVSKVAAASGFTTRESFCRSFKKQYSLTPTEYRAGAT
jgi:AraC-like DNA-binding protein